MQSLGTIMTRQRLWWARHLSRLPDIYLPKKSSSRCTHLARDHMEPHVVDSRMSSKVPCWGQTSIRSIGRRKLQKSSSQKKTASFKNTRRQIEDNKRDQRKDRVFPSPKYSYPTRWLWTSLQMKHRTHFTQKKCQ